MPPQTNTSIRTPSLLVRKTSIVSSSRVGRAFGPKRGNAQLHSFIPIHDQAKTRKGSNQPRGNLVFLTVLLNHQAKSSIGLAMMVRSVPAVELSVLPNRKAFCTTPSMSSRSDSGGTHTFTERRTIKHALRSARLYAKGAPAQDQDLAGGYM